MTTIEFDHRLEEHQRAARLFYRATSRFARIDRVAAIVLVLLGLVVTAVMRESWGIICLALAPLEWFNLLSIEPLIVRYVFRRTKKFHERTRLSFSEERIHYWTPSIDSALDWSLFSRLVEDEELFLLLYRAPRSYAIIPKRAFDTDALQAEFRRLATNKLVRVAA